MSLKTAVQLAEQARDKEREALGKAAEETLQRSSSADDGLKLAAEHHERQRCAASAVHGGGEGHAR